MRSLLYYIGPPVATVSHKVGRRGDDVRNDRKKMSENVILRSTSFFNFFFRECGVIMRGLFRQALLATGNLFKNSSLDIHILVCVSVQALSHTYTHVCQS